MPSCGKIVAQPRQRPLVQEAGQIVGAIGKKLAAAEPDEEIEIFALDPLGVRRARRLGERRMRQPERARVAVQAPEAAQQSAVGARDSSSASSAYSCARAASTSSTSHGRGDAHR